MASEVAALAGSIPGMAATILSDLSPLLALGLGLSLAAAVIGLVRSMV